MKLISMKVEDVLLARIDAEAKAQGISRTKLLLKPFLTIQGGTVRAIEGGDLGRGTCPPLYEDVPEPKPKAAKTKPVGHNMNCRCWQCKGGK